MPFGHASQSAPRPAPTRLGPEGLEETHVAQEGYDKLMALTDSRYRLSMIVARRAAQLKAGIPSVLDVDELPRTQNTVTIAMKELETTNDVVWGDELPSADELKRAAEPRRTETTTSYAPAPFDDDDA